MTSLSYTVPLAASELKKVLKVIQEGETIWEKDQEYLYIKSMVEHIGSTDSELRDSLIYGTFCKLTLDKQLDQQLLIELLKLCLGDNMLFKGIGESGSDTVFTRSFTTLLIALILYRDNEEGFLSSEMVLEIKDQLIDYINLENDMRGYVPRKGWAHSVAHVADAFDELVKNKNITEDLYEELLIALWNKVFVADTVYVHDEDERLLGPMMEMLDRGLKHEVIKNMIQVIHVELEKQKEMLEEESYWILYANVKNFLKSFYLRTDGLANLNSLHISIKQSILKM
ncbi:hypothetical protein JMA_02470 [Jeotgalibacillus malaysiensis]|uniref:DUF2785 domain-containing protein n=1 Tax=Jeotgalibacillus malaysiensis TaxID=1508404 RepID=A0A0B5ANI7_9BACL|nr:DUF2785 domain-containing protein [Jeotgalibacillus malaysiensis]AJD89564.1 hypothetical protein JMA_02470 [Jeotgalibacillus malaysiensis]